MKRRREHIYRAELNLFYKNIAGNGLDVNQMSIIDTYPYSTRIFL